ncbi:MAG: carboxylesterase family protein [Deltaproteobacteria bacterium]|nr:carboxylesterase family protein [Deltaproteobacteria bacterium]
MAKIITKPVMIESGQVTGHYEDNGQIAVFKGIPYAKPPISDLRWRPPQPVDAWEGVKSCTSFSASAFQTLMDINKFFNELIRRQGWSWPRTTLIRLLFSLMPAPKQSEDCLYLNIRTPSLETNAKLPVMFWIHGGDHLDGSGSEPFYQSNALSHKGIVLVTINYRLGIMGYFGHPELSRESDQGVSGNYGTLDQIFALKWVQQNISAFGGNPGDVTIFGESAGGESVAHLMTSPLSRGLFRKAIMQSPANSGQMIHLRHAFMDHPSLEDAGKNFAGLLVSSSDKQLAELRKVPAKVLYESLRKNPKMSEFFPNVDGYVLEKSPFEVFLNGEQAKVPVLLGSNSDEATVIYPLFPVPLVELKHREVTPDNVAGILKEEFGEDTAELFNLYPGAKQGKMDSLIAMLGDSMFGAKVHFYALQAAKGGQKAYLYFFTRVPPSPKQTAGAFHAAEVPFVFNHSIPILPLTKQDLNLSELMVDYWTQFAKTGDPNASNRPEWPAVSPDSPEYMVLGDKSGRSPIERKVKYDIFNKRLLRQIEQIKTFR